MKKKITQVLALVAVLLLSSVNAKAQHLVTFADLYETIKAEAAASGPGSQDSGTKYLLNADRVIDIYTFKSPSNRTFRIDVAEIGFANGVTTTVRLETNGASNSTNGRKIYINCPSAGTLTVGGYAETTGRGYTVETESGTVISNEAASLPDTKNDKANKAVQTFQIAEAGVVVLNPNAGIYYSFLDFVPAGSTSIASVAVEKVVKSVAYYDVLGRPVDADYKGIVIEKTVYDDNSVTSHKIVQLRK